MKKKEIPTKTKRLVFVTNDAWFFVSHRLPIAIRALKEGYSVHVIAKDDKHSRLITQAGCEFHAWNLNPRGTGVVQEFNAITALARLIWRLQPDVLHLVTIKAVLYGGLIARIVKPRAVVFAVSGLGAFFVSETPRMRFLRRLLLPLYKGAVRHPNARVIFQNPDDCSVFASRIRNPPEHQIIRGSGVNLSLFGGISEPPTQPPIVVTAARLLWDKGIGELVEAAKVVRSEYPDVRFLVAGGHAATGNPAAISEQELAAIAESGAVEFLGARDDIAHLYQTATIICLPSWREGMPKALQEAAAAGRPVVTTDVPGCRDAILPGVSGLLVPVKEPAALAAALIQLLEDPGRCQEMGVAGRQLAERWFSIDTIVEQHIALYAALLEK